jgi:hypothetical protein
MPKFNHQISTCVVTILLPKKLEYEFKNYISQPKIQESMLYTKEYLTKSSIFENAVTEIRKEEREQGLEQGREQEREHLIMNSRQRMGFSAKQIADILGFHAQYVQSVIDKFEKKE